LQLKLETDSCPGWQFGCKSQHFNHLKSGRLLGRGQTIALSAASIRIP